MGDKQTPDLITREVNGLFKSEIELFIPKFYRKHNKYEKQKDLFQGYIFVKACFKIASSVSSRLTMNLYFEEFLKRGNGAFATVNDGEVDEMKGKLKELIDSEFHCGDTVEICNSVFDKLQATVIDVLDENSISLQVKDLRSRKVIINLPHYCLKKIEG